MKISFVIPSHNCAAFLPHAVESCLNQTYKDIEVVIVDDCSTDSTPELCEHFKKDSRIVVTRNDKNMGRSESRNIGNKIATGDIICVLDADDLADPKRAALTHGKFARGADVVYGSAIVIDALGFQYQRLQADFIPGRKIQKMNEAIASGNVHPQDLQLGIVHSSMSYSKKVADKYLYAGGDVAKLGLDDWELQVRMLRDGLRFEVIPAIITHYRMTSTAISQNRSIEAVIECKKNVLASLTEAKCA